MRPFLAASVLAVFVAGCGGGGGHASSSPSGSSVTFAANSIVFGVANGTGDDYAVQQFAPTGGEPTTVVADVPGSILAFALDPSASRYALAADPSEAGTYGIYLAKGLALTNATRLVAPAYTSVGSLAVTRDGGHVVYTAASADGTSRLYAVSTSGGTPVDFGPADAATVSPADGDTIAYVAPSSGEGDDGVFTRSLTAGASGAARLIASDAGNHALPAFSPDGTRLAYWTLAEGGNALTVQPLAGGSGVSIPGVGAIEPQGEAFGPDGGTLALVGGSGASGAIATVPVDGSAGPTTILTNAGLLGNYGFFWTDANGRAVAGARAASAGSRRRRP